jgi:hypothetical protein
MLIACAQRRELNLEILLSLAHCLCGISFAIVPRRGLMAQKFYYYYLSTTCFIVSTQIETEKLKNQFVTEILTFQNTPTARECCSATGSTAGNRFWTTYIDDDCQTVMAQV